MISLVFILLYVISCHGLIWVYLELPGLPGPVCLFPSPKWESLQSFFFFNFFFWPFLSFLDPYNANFLFLMLSQKFLKMSSLFKITFSSYCSVWIISIALFSSSPMCFFFCLIKFTVELKYIFQLNCNFCWYFLFFSFLDYHCVHLFFSQVQWALLWLLFCIIYQIVCLFSFH